MRPLGAVTPKRRRDPLKAPRDFLRELGYESYSDYLQSEHWHDMKARYRASKVLPQRCAICDAEWVELHHRTYRRIGKEQASDLVALCRHHHRDLHRTYGWDDETLLLGHCTSQYIAQHEMERAKARHVAAQVRQLPRDGHRQRVRKVACPRCGALEGELCVGPRGGRRASNHKVRVDEYNRLRALAA